MVRRDLVGQGLDQLDGAEGGRFVVRVLDADEGGAARQWRCRLGGDDAVGIVLVGVQIVGPVLIDEVEAADGVLDVELVLEAVGDRLRAADQEQVVGHLSGSTGPGPAPWRARKACLVSVGRTPSPPVNSR